MKTIKMMNYAQFRSEKGKASYTLCSTQIKNPTIRDSHESFGYRLYWLRTKLGLSQKEFAARIEEKGGFKFTAKDVWNYENEKTVPKANKLAALCRATNLDIDFWEGSTSKKYRLDVIKNNVKK